MFDPDKVKGLNALEMGVYNYVMPNLRQVVHMKIRDLADEAHVSTTTVLRFTRKLGFEGFSEFKLYIKQQLKEIPAEKPELEIGAILNFYRRVQDEEFKERIEAAAQALNTADEIVFIGIGTSGSLGKYGARYFANAGKYSLFIDDPFYPSVARYSEKVAVMALSASGETPQMLEMLAPFKQWGDFIISITNEENCTLAKMSDINFAYYMPKVCGEEYTLNMTSQVPVVHIIETLGRKLVPRKKEL